MEHTRKTELSKLTLYRLSKGLEYLKEPAVITELNKSYQEKFAKSLNEESEIPKYEEKPMPFDKFKNEQFVVMMTDIRKSKDIIDGYNGVRNMFLIFYTYSAVVANIVDKYKGTATEFLGDGVLNLFDCDDGLDESLKNSFLAANDIMEAKDYILNPIYSQFKIPQIRIGIGIDHGFTIVTRFGYKADNDLKAFGKCVYNVSRLCKGDNIIEVSSNSKNIWPSGIGGRLNFSSTYDADGKIAYIPYII